MNITSHAINAIHKANPTKSRPQCAEMLGRMLAAPVIALMWVVALASYAIAALLLAQFAAFLTTH